MTIVASNNITVSNVNDGTITHYAYANSADGKDGFYISGGTNLAHRTSSDWQKVSVPSNEWGVTALCDSIYEIVNGETYTVQVEVRNITAPVMLELWSFNVAGNRNGLLAPVQATNNDGKISITFTANLPDGYAYFMPNLAFVSPINDAGSYEFRQFKVEKGSVATPWSPAPSEAHPSYIGQYRDFTQADSTTPSDYTWAVFKGSDGISPTVTINPDTSLTIVDAQGTRTTTVLKGAGGADGTSGIIVSSVAPSSPQIGQLWQDTSTTPQLVKKWTGNEWVIWKMYVENMVVDTISSMSSDLGDINAGTMKLMDDVDVNGAIKKHGIYQSKMGLLSSGPSLATPSAMSNSQMGVANLNKGELRFIVTNYTEDLKKVQETGMSDPNTAFIQFNSYDDGKDVMLIGSSGDIVFKGITSQDTPWIAMGNGAYYKNMFSRVYISYSVKATSTADIPLGVLPVGLRPFRGLHLTANAWAATLVNDRHIEVRTTGEVTLYNPANGASYDGEVSFTL